MPYPDLDADEATRVAAQATTGAQNGRLLNLSRMLLHSQRSTRRGRRTSAA